jgi:hypothetical protein
MSADTNAASAIPANLTDGELVDRIGDLLKGVSNTRAQNVLKMLGAVHNIRFVPAYAPQSGPKQVPPTRDTRGQRKSRSQPKTSPEIKLIRSKINKVNKLISLESAKLGGQRLPEDHPLILKRGQLFRALKREQNKNLKTFEEAFEDEVEGASQSGAEGDPQGPPSPDF